MPTQNIFDLVDTWASGGGPYTSIKMNATDNDSGSASLLMDLQVGGSSKFKVSKSGTITAIAGSATAGSQGITFDGNTVAGLYAASSQLYLTGNAINAVGQLMVTNNLNITNDSAYLRLGASFDAIISRRAAANLRLGAADAAAPVAQTLSVQSVVAGTTNTAGANLTITGSQGTGTGAGGSIIFQVAPAGGSGTAQNALSTALTIGSDRNATFANNVTIGGTNISASGTIQLVSAGSIGLSIAASQTLSRLSLGITDDSANKALLFLDAANTLALRNGTAAQTFRMYSTYTSDTDYSRLSIFDVSGDTAWYIKPQNLTSGAARSIVIGSSDAGGTSVYFQTAGSIRWRVDSAGHFLANADNLYDIGASGATRPRNLYLGGSLTLGGNITSSGGITIAAAGYFIWPARASLDAVAADIVRLNGSSAGGALQLTEMTAPAAPATDNVRIYAEDNGSGKTRIMARFATGAAVQIAIEP